MVYRITCEPKTMPPERIELPAFGSLSSTVQDQRSTTELRRHILQKVLAQNNFAVKEK
jgi:hypothetical protein